jgi:hypothetical protein
MRCLVSIVVSLNLGLDSTVYSFRFIIVDIIIVAFYDIYVFEVRIVPTISYLSL